MKIVKYLNKNKIGGLILIIVIIIAFGFGGFGGGFMSNNQNNLAKINKTNITTKFFIDYINQSGISQKAIKDNLNNNIIEELLASLISTTLLSLEIEDFKINLSENSLSHKIKSNKNFADKNGVFQRTKYEKFLLETNTTAPIFEQKLKERELQKKLFDYVGAGTVSPQFLIKKLYKNENKNLELDFIDLDKFYKKKDEFNDNDLIKFIDENADKFKVDYIDYKYTLVNPKNLIGVEDFNQTFFDKIDEIENNITNGVSFDQIISNFNLDVNIIKNYKYSENSNEIENKIYELRNNGYDMFENNENFIIYKIDNLEKKSPNINEKKTKDEIINLLVQKNKFDFNKELLENIQNNKFTNADFIELGKNQIQKHTLNSVRDNKKFNIESVKMLYSLPEKSLTLINDDNNKIYLTTIQKYQDIDLETNTDEFKNYISKENTNNKNSILKSYDFFLNNKYEININQKAINKIKNLFQ